MIPAILISLALATGLPVIAANAIYIAELEEQITEIEAEKPKPACPSTGSPVPGCGRRDK